MPTARHQYSVEHPGFDNVRVLACRASRQDVAAFGELYRLYHPRLLRFVGGRVTGRQEAEDLTSLCFEKAFAAIGRYHPTPAQFSTWLYAIARNLVIDHYRKRRLPIDPDTRLESVEVSDPSCGPEELFAHQELRRLLHDALMELTTEQRQVVGLRFFYNMPISEVAGLMNKTDGAIKALQFRAFDRLRTILTDDMRVG